VQRRRDERQGKGGEQSDAHTGTGSYAKSGVVEVTRCRRLATQLDADDAVDPDV
jgi:hypothetical protein